MTLRPRRTTTLTRSQPNKVRLSLAAASYVDEQVAARAGRAGWTTLQSVVDQAVARFHPEQVAIRERRGRHGWDVTLDHGPDLDGFSASKGALKIPIDKPLPDSLVRTLIVARCNEIGIPL